MNFDTYFNDVLDIVSLRFDNAELLTKEDINNIFNKLRNIRNHIESMKTTNDKLNLEIEKTRNSKALIDKRFCDLKDCFVSFIENL